MTRRRNRPRGAEKPNKAPEQIAPDAISEPAEPAGRSERERLAGTHEPPAAEKSRAKTATDRLSLALRVVLFAAACIFAVVGVRGFIDATNTQATASSVTTESVKGQTVRHALVLFSGDDSDADVAYERSGVLGPLGKSGISFDTIYLEAEPSESALEAKILANSDVRGGYDVAIAAGCDALAYVTGHQELFGGIPTVFFAVSDVEAAKAAQQAGIATGYIEEGASTLSLQMASELMPSASRAIILVDGTAESEGLLAQVNADSAVAANVVREIWDVSAMSRSELADRLAQCPSDAFVLLLGANHDSGGARYTSTETAYFLAEHSSVPVFSALGGVGEGVCGASFIDREAEGQSAVRTAVALMNGASVLSEPVTEVNPACSVFDATVLEARGLNPDATPETATIINESAFSWRTIRYIVQPLLFLLAAVLCIVAFGVIGFRRSVKSNRALVESRNDLQYRLYHDLLTELPNRYALEQFTSDPAQSERLASVVQVDINDFTDINNSYGHALGNEVIKIVAKRLSGIDSAFLARSGGDEFILVFDRRLAPDCSELRHLARVFSEPLVVGDNKVELSSRVGIANRDAGISGTDLVAFSDLALHDAKQNNVQSPVFYGEHMRESMEKKLQITDYLKHAISEESIEVLWQPQVNTVDLTVTGYEALCRLHGNRYYPSDFIPVAEMSGLISPLDRIVTKKVVAQLGEWLKQGRKVGVASINYSAAQLRDKGYCDFLADLLAQHNVPASLIKIEITESMILDNEEAANQLFERLRSMGVTLALDDFGTGYSSLDRMARRPIDVVKLDKSLVDAFMAPGKEGFIGDITQLIHGLNKSIVVEGVETYDQYCMCLDFGCDVMQGYFFSRPVKAAEAIDFDPTEKVSEARAAAGDKTRNSDWKKYERDERGRWKKKQ